jgi:hypothetical protein
LKVNNYYQELSTFMLLVASHLPRISILAIYILPTITIIIFIKNILLSIFIKIYY